MTKYLVLLALLFSGCGEQQPLDPSVPRTNQGIEYTDLSGKVVTNQAIGYTEGFRGARITNFMYFCRSMVISGVKIQEVIYKKYDNDGYVVDVKIVGSTCRFI